MTRAYRVYGLTGGIAAGKSTVARILESMGLPIIDADQIARDISAPGGRAHEAILERFGTADRAQLRQIVFSDSKARKDLEALLHPLIQIESLARMETIKAPVVIYEAALLVETGRDKELDGLLVVEAPKAERIRRLVERDQTSTELAEKMTAAQTADDERRARATWIIRNDQGLPELEAQVRGWIYDRAQNDSSATSSNSR